MKTGFEINMVVCDIHQALKFYEEIFDIEIVEKTTLAKGNNEAIFHLYGGRVHLLDENKEAGLLSPKEAVSSIWFNITVPSIKETFRKAMANHSQEIMPITKMENFGVSNAVFQDIFGYMWMLHEVHRELTLEERENMFRDR